MPTKQLSLVLLVLVLPVALLTFFAVRLLSLENDALNVRHERLARQRMDAAAATVASRLQSLGSEVLAQTQAAYAAGGGEALSGLARKRLFTYAIVFKQGVPLHSVMALEHQYDLARALQDKAQTLAAKSSTPETSSAALVPWAGGYTLLRCAQSTADNDVCIAVDNTEVMRVLRSAIDLASQNTGLSAVALVAPDGLAIGPAEAAAPGEASHGFDGLLSGWQLHGHEPQSDRDLQATTSLYMIAAALIAGWLAMMWMLYRSFALKEQAAAARANVIAQLAHELRTPLSNLRLHTDLLQRKSTDVAAVRRYGAVLDVEIDRLANLAENAIAVARGAMNKPKLETAVPDDCLRAILQRFEPTLADARCSVRFTAGAANMSRFDRTAWERCIVNLIDNARKYAPGSEIDIATTQQSELLRLEVSDHGPGIAAHQREQIFEPLERGVATEASGFGLGLAAVRALARQNGGSCWVEAMNPGARFVLTMQTLPVEAQLQGSGPAC